MWQWLHQSQPGSVSAKQRNKKGHFALSPRASHQELPCVWCIHAKYVFRKVCRKFNDKTHGISSWIDKFRKSEHYSMYVFSNSSSNLVVHNSLLNWTWNWDRYAVCSFDNHQFDPPRNIRHTKKNLKYLVYIRVQMNEFYHNGFIFVHSVTHNIIMYELTRNKPFLNHSRRYHNLRKNL